jgi:hypothetical protein
MGIFSWVEEIHEYLDRKPSVLKAGAPSTYFPVRIEWAFWKQHFLHLRCFKVEIGSVSSKLAYSAELKKHMFHSKDNHLFKKQEHVEHCFLVRTELVLRVLLLAIQAFKVEKGWFCSKWAYLSRGRKTCVHPKKTMYVGSCTNYLIVSLWKLGNLLKEIFPAYRSYHGVKTSFDTNRTIQLTWNTCESLQKHHLGLKLQLLAHCFTVRIELHFDSNNSCKSEFSGINSFILSK